MPAENGNDVGITMLPSASPVPCSCSTTATTCPSPPRAGVAWTRFGAPRSRFSWSKSCTIRSTGVPPVWAGSWIHSPQSAGNESRYALTARGRPISPAETRRSISTYSAKNRTTWATMNALPLAAAAPRIASASASVSASGFSSRTCLPAANARSAASRWSGVGRQMSTASISGSESTVSRSSTKAAPTEAATFSPRSREREQTALTFARPLRAA